jgi:hypothetical protein
LVLANGEQPHRDSMIQGPRMAGRKSRATDLDYHALDERAGRHCEPERSCESHINA